MDSKESKELKELKEYNENARIVLGIIKDLKSYDRVMDFKRYLDRTRYHSHNKEIQMAFEERLTYFLDGGK